MNSSNSPGPVHGVAFNPFGPFVVLTATATVNSEEVTVQEQVDRAAWWRISSDAQLRADYEQRLRHRLAAAFVDRLSPTITVHEPPVPLGDAVSAALARADAAMRNESEPERCQRPGLRWEG
ncbi:hypothetical protein ABZ599_16535 [Streptomyces misionensis]|uniref:hypothetical protein n=1 Tax=Streptomyces misionensis TaxID=67331 RepID=UPI0033C9E542